MKSWIISGLLGIVGFQMAYAGTIGPSFRIDSDTAVSVTGSQSNTINAALSTAQSNTAGAAAGLTALQTNVATLAVAAALGGFAGTEAIMPLSVACSRFGFGSGSEAIGNYWTALGAQSGYQAVGDDWIAMGQGCGIMAIHSNSTSVGAFSGYKATGNNRLYIDVYSLPPVAYAAGDAINDMIFGDNGTLHLGRTGAHGGQTNVLRGNWTGPFAQTSVIATQVFSAAQIPAHTLTLTNGTIIADGVINGSNSVWMIPPGSTNRYFIPLEVAP